VAIIKTVTNGSNSAQFKAVSLGHVIAIVFGLVSLLGAQQTWLMAAANEREAIIEEIKRDNDRSREAHERVDSAKFDEINRRLAEIETQVHALERQVMINTGRIERLR
jgi:tetrahydromethanopterin S-methyltransferase subunit G